MASKDRFDVHFEREYQPPALGSWEDSENQLLGPEKPYFLRANTGPRWILGGIISRPFIHAEQTGGRFAISSIESSKVYNPQQQPLSRWLTFFEVDHCFCVQEGLLRVQLRSSERQPSGIWNEIREGQTILIAAGETFMMDFGSRFVRVWSFASGEGIEQLIRNAGTSYQGFVLPEKAELMDESRVMIACQKLKVSCDRP